MIEIDFDAETCSKSRSRCLTPIGIIAKIAQAPGSKPLSLKTLNSRRLVVGRVVLLERFPCGTAEVAMNVLVCRLLILGMAMAFVGCGGEPEQVPREVGHQETSPAGVNVAAASAEKPGPEKPAPAVEERQPATSKPPGPSRPPASPPPARAAQPSAEPSIRLSAGVALPQSLPTGTAMGMSVDYVFTAGQPVSSQRYVWVIEPAKGNLVKQRVQLSQRGTLQAFFPQLRPENGPFRAYIESSDGSRLSTSISLR